MAILFFAFSEREKMAIWFFAFSSLIFILYLRSRTNYASSTEKESQIFSFPSFAIQPLSSFPSLSKQNLFSLPSLSTRRSFLSFPSLFSLPSLSRQARTYDTTLENGVSAPETEIIEKSVVYEELRNTPADGDETKEEGGGESIEETWSAIMASGKAKPVKMKKSETWERSREILTSDHKPEMKKSVREKRRKEKNGGEAAAVGGGAVQGRRRREVLVEDDKLFNRIETFIKKHYDHLKLQRQESDQRRLMERLWLGNRTNLAAPPITLKA